jgi:calreticulin
MLTSATLLAIVASTSAKVLYKETFGADWDKSWAVGKSGDKELGKWELTAGDYYGGEEADAKGIMTSEDMRHYFLSTKFDAPISNKDSDIVVQYSIKYTKTPECGGSYIKMLGDFETADFDNDTPYNVMFGPDQCGGTKRVHSIFTYKDENHLKTSDVYLSIYDELTHVYSFVIKKDQTYEVFVDLESKATGKIEDDWTILKPKKIDDPDVSKPDDWVEDSMMDDPEDKKPAGWDDIPKTLPDPEAEKPDDWDDEDDGEWEPPTIDNPEFKGEWSAKRIDNPAYKGEWVQPEIDNPEYKPDAAMTTYSFGGLGFELWQTKGGSLIDNIIITDSWDDAKAFAEETWSATKDAEKKMKEDAEAAKTAKDAEDAKADADTDDTEEDEKEEEKGEL